MPFNSGLGAMSCQRETNNTTGGNSVEKHQIALSYVEQRQQHSTGVGVKLLTPMHLYSMTAGQSTARCHCNLLHSGRGSKLVVPIVTSYRSPES